MLTPYFEFSRLPLDLQNELFFKKEACGERPVRTPLEVGSILNLRPTTPTPDVRLYRISITSFI
jgi:hypothetical protein